ncbi:DUF2243 domain-containing protein [Microbacterium sp. RD1]|uniref:DUF2243 domain-containing protein n=1 Tax=Microbacterium sp. RD1 TaxID=3457313 RepID=UPI003FA5BF8F
MSRTNRSTQSPATVPAGSAPSRGRVRIAWSGVLFGVGLIAFLDEAVFHQLLSWHHFYDRGTTAIGLVSDGVFHAFSWFATIAGLFLLADLRRRGALRWARWWGGALTGAGAFQLYDGLINHKVLRVHQIRASHWRPRRSPAPSHPPPTTASPGTCTPTFSPA